MMSLRLADDPHCSRSPVLGPIEVGKADLVVVGLDGLACAIPFCVASSQLWGGVINLLTFSNLCFNRYGNPRMIGHGYRSGYLAPCLIYPMLQRIL